MAYKRPYSHLMNSHVNELNYYISLYRENPSSENKDNLYRALEAHSIDEDFSYHFYEDFYEKISEMSNEKLIEMFNKTIADQEGVESSEDEVTPDNINEFIGDYIKNNLSIEIDGSASSSGLEVTIYLKGEKISSANLYL